MQLLGKPLAAGVTAEVRARLSALGALHLVSVVASGDPATLVYVESKRRQAEKLGVRLSVRDLGAEVSQAELHRVLRELSDDETVHGVVLELPLAPALDPDAALRQIVHPKDIEGLTPANLALVSAGRESEALLPPTPRSVRFLLREALELSGARVAIIGPGRTVGRPLAWMLNNRGATVTLCNEFTRDLAGVLERQDAVVVAVGRAGLLKPEHVLPHHVVIDAGINVTAGGVVGDVAPEVGEIVRAYTPVPGGVGPLTSALMFQNLVRAVRLQRGEKVE
ncbi:bifunctional 5,10-methylenetetrahydrofolate dehydrogenase/5,10-methenyltetrahydrofolate cyclohydrolase [Deinococcus psychrotolerans]|uniref:Bifunctional protein FolD n=1 Tax=Deinococcus psychrotolerans TaxID=2489213 RepID=A0A3G8YLI8_9DEIO|nr:bifunctional 5,10-methylenetetrahydrofolate dehydrogenase/5,10-methenyltetrahydrofolate cyclohydrolase [Deinococcus psychrotolerans]AZI42471.1 bifunctional 5,10-methylenetetrahydrofolate dehydrogenase/5,10-methenyltetrahydrofolate cyclohydrolase [Deinococcus psychrotolerans]